MLIFDTNLKPYFLKKTDWIKGVTESFTNSDLTAGVYTFNHKLNSQFLTIAVYDNNNREVTPDEITVTDADNTNIDLSSYGAIPETWHVVGQG